MAQEEEEARGYHDVRGEETRGDLIAAATGSSRRRRTKEPPPEEDHDNMVETAWDDITGEELDAANKLEASQDLDMNYYDRLEVFDEAEIT